MSSNGERQTETGDVASVPEIWVIDDDGGARRSLAAMVKQHSTAVSIRCFRGLDEADSRLRQTRPAGALVDDRLRGCLGHLWIESRRAALDGAHVVLCTGYPDPIAAAAAYTFGNGILLKPVSSASIRRFVQRVLAPATLDASVARLAMEWRLSPTHTRVLALAARGLRRDHIAQELQVKPRTVKAHVRELLRRADLTDLQEVLVCLLAEMDDRAARVRARQVG